MTEYTDQYFEGERPLFAAKDAVITRTTFGEGESPLKESHNIELKDSIFKWKYPLWYSKHVNVDHTIFETMSDRGFGTRMILRLLIVPYRLRSCFGARITLR